MPIVLVLIWSKIHFRLVCSYFKFKIVKMVVDIVLLQKSFDQKTALCGVSPLAGHFFQSHPVENGFPVSTFPYLNTIWKTNS